MKGYNRFFIYLMVLLPLLTACSETDDGVEEFANWREVNETYFDNLYRQAVSAQAGGSTEWKVFTQYSLEESRATTANEHVVVQVLEERGGSGCPLYSDTVRIHYQGRLLPSASYPEGYVFDQSWTGSYSPQTSTPAKMGVSQSLRYNSSTGTTYYASNIEGFTTVLQHMHIGDRWRVYIPYTLGYDASGSDAIPGYSTLIFDITLVAYYKPGETVPDWK